MSEQPESIADRVSLIEEALIEHWGERCAEFSPGCKCCEAWNDFFLMKAENAELRAEVERLKWAFNDARLIASNHAEHVSRLLTQLATLRTACKAAKQFCDRIHDGAEDSPWWAKEAGLHLETLTAALK